MKQIILLLIIFLNFYSINSFSQTLEQDEIDEFTGDVKKRTAFEALYMGWDFTAYYCLLKVNDNYYLRFKIMLASGGVFAIGKDEKLMLKLQNNDMITLLNLEYAITNYGGGAIGLIGSNALGLEVDYKISVEQLNTLKNNKLSKIRIYTTKDYLEAEINKNKASKFIDVLSLIE
jgi:hypothetical protein